jgi:hypothetical protein
MPSYNTIAQILVATSIASSALAAPSPAQEMYDARADLSQLDRRMSDGAKTAATAGLIAGGIWGVAGVTGKLLNSVIPTVHYPNSQCVSILSEPSPLNGNADLFITPS